MKADEAGRTMAEAAVQGRGVFRDAEEKEQYVSFIIEKEFYGVDILKVQEIVGMTKITSVPSMAAYMKGVINLRGKVVPVVDMRMKFRMPERAYDMTTVILIVSVKGREVGMIVDSVSDVIDIPREKIQDTQHFKASIEAEFIIGIGNVDDNLIILLDVDRILSADELEHIDKNQ
jgi:purine-binding chemotaxis protein CheW